MGATLLCYQNATEEEEAKTDLLTCLASPQVKMGESSHFDKILEGNLNPAMFGQFLKLCENWIHLFVDLFGQIFCLSAEIVCYKSPFFTPKSFDFEVKDKMYE